MKVDLHGTYIYELERKLDAIVLEALSNSVSQVELITGQGPLQKKVIQLCKELYGYHTYTKLGNAGIVILDLE